LWSNLSGHLNNEDVGTPVWGLPNLGINIVSGVLIAVVVASTTLALVFACVLPPYPLFLGQKARSTTWEGAKLWEPQHHL
jgi:hypothetical protein